ncbi:hypothetical protein JQ604_06055 [Bradyrhizobium jicamae]|uniref:hypothetical protein n=1 Tax=Bradyrhizobium jicamae TaxID=280332 RepID=UPI001BAB9709|nr:hypothetical protein [Bradyrhizobium jicamae]MBR0751739.1 hypothetical protein [Bradyrhizobium jicamae]
MARKPNPPRSPTSVQSADKRQLADLATLLGLMQAASKLSQDLDALANEVGGSLEKMAERFGVPFFEVHNTYRRQIARPKGKKASKPRKRRSAAG